MKVVGQIIKTHKQSKQAIDLPSQRIAFNPIMKFHPFSQSMNRATRVMIPTTQATFFQGGDNPKERTSRNNI